MKYLTLRNISASILMAGIILFAPLKLEAVTNVSPTTELGDPNEDVRDLQLKPGKLIGVHQLTEAVLKRVVTEGMCFDVMCSDAKVIGPIEENDKDGFVNKEDIVDDAVVEAYFVNGASAIAAKGAEIWGIHLPHSTKDAQIQLAYEAHRQKAVANHIRVMRLAMQYLKPKVIVIHPGHSSYYTFQDSYDEAKSSVRRSLAEIQAELDVLNSSYNLNTILCVENCPRRIAYDAESLFDLLDYEGLEKIKICLDTGHAQVPLNGGYLNKQNSEYKTAITNGDVVAMLKKFGTRLGTLHIQQNVGGVGVTPATGESFDTHHEPFTGGEVDWGEFYYELLKNNRYRGCFLYETEKTASEAKSTLESTNINYKNVILPAYETYKTNNPTKQ